MTGTLVAPIAAVRPAGAAASPATNATIVDREDLTPSVARFVVRPDDGPVPFRPGQYLALGLGLGGRLVQRPYSTASSAVSRDLEFLVRLVVGGELTPRLWSLQEGARLRVGRPKGLFTLIDDDPRTHLFVATGTGIAPFISMLDALRARAQPPRAIVLHGVARTSELAYRDRLAGWSARGRLAYVPVISRPEASGKEAWAGMTGHVDAVLDGLLRTDAFAAGETVAYLCGNPGMLASAGRVLTAAGLKPEAIRSEQYWVAGPAGA